MENQNNKETFGKKVKNGVKKVLPIVIKFTARAGAIAVGTYVGNKLYSKTLKHPMYIVELDPKDYKITDLPGDTDLPAE